MAQTTNDLLKQAIADAEAVRETAVANAKLVLEEAITPQIRDMIARRLRVESATEKPHEDGRAERSSQMPADTSNIGHGENKEPSDDSFDSSTIGTGPENSGTSDDDWYEDWSESDFDLNEVIAELEQDIARLTDSTNMHDEDEQTDEMVGGIGIDSQKHPHAHANPRLKMDNVGGVAPSDEDELDLDELLRELEDEAEDDSSNDGDDSDSFDLDELLRELEDEEHEDDEEKIDLEEILAELEAEEEKDKHSSDEKEEMATEIADLRAEVAQYRGAVNTLRGKLNEVNLLNAKLLFTNKMFRRTGLSNEQKVRIVESFDRATTVREVKLVYTALMENISSNGGSPSASRKKVVAEGIASRAIPSTAPKKEVIVENSVAKRLQELAGLI